MTVLNGNSNSGEPTQQLAGATPATDPVQLAAEIDEFFSSAFSERYPQVPNELANFLLQHHQPYKLGPFVEAYLTGSYPSERLTGLIYRFTEVRLQLEYVGINLGLENEHYYDPVSTQLASSVSARRVLIRMALQQSVVGASRAGWEKLMRSVYFMETGCKELPRTSARSAKTAFFDWAETQDKWRFMTAYKGIVTQHDEKFRTPEYHTNSVLRARIQGRDKVDPEKLLALTNYMQGVIWPNIIAIAGDNRPYMFTDLHVGAGGTFVADEKYGMGALPAQPSPS